MPPIMLDIVLHRLGLSRLDVDFKGRGVLGIDRVVPGKLKGKLALALVTGFQLEDSGGKAVKHMDCDLSAFGIHIFV